MVEKMRCGFIKQSTYGFTQAVLHPTPREIFLFFYYYSQMKKGIVT